jgi:hypothetical protein
MGMASTHGIFCGAKKVFRRRSLSIDSVLRSDLRIAPSVWVACPLLHSLLSFGGKTGRALVALVLLCKHACQAVLKYRSLSLQCRMWQWCQLLYAICEMLAPNKMPTPTRGPQSRNAMKMHADAEVLSQPNAKSYIQMSSLGIQLGSCCDPLRFPQPLYMHHVLAMRNLEHSAARTPWCSVAATVGLFLGGFEV